MSRCGYALLNHPGNGNRGCWQEAMSKREENHDGKQAGALCAVVFFITLLIESQYDWDGGR
jgi:hypothetical protein